MADGDKMPAMMTAVAISQPGGPLVLKPEKRAVPEPGEGEILIRVRAAGVNRPDVQQRKGAYPPPPEASDLPGLEVSGEVVAVGQGGRRWRLGDAVCALTPGGGYAEYAKVHESNALPVPQGFTLTEAAALPETFFTVWHNVFERGGLKAGETLLVHGGSSGIGTTAIQLASALGAYVITTAGSAEKCEACLKLGADRAVNYREQDFATQGGAVASADFSKLMVKRLVHTGSTLRPRTIEFKGQIAAALEAQVWPLLAARRVVPVMDMIFPLREAWRAHERMEEGEHIGKIVLDVA